MKKNFNELISRRHRREDRINEPAEKSIKITQTETEREYNSNHNNSRRREHTKIWDTIESIVYI